MKMASASARCVHSSSAASAASSVAWKARIDPDADRCLSGFVTGAFVIV
jgi:hypothetical protein